MTGLLAPAWCTAGGECMCYFLNERHAGKEGGQRWNLCPDLSVLGLNFLLPPRGQPQGVASEPQGLPSGTALPK